MMPGGGVEAYAHVCWHEYPQQPRLDVIRKMILFSYLHLLPSWLRAPTYTHSLSLYPLTLNIALQHPEPAFFFSFSFSVRSH